jgi:RimJ/RimL family protein N-acetyltransferase
MKTLAAGALTLEPQVVAHAPEMFALLQDPLIYSYENEPPATLQGLSHRFMLLESRASADGSEHWLNWVVRRADGLAIGYVQATVFGQGQAYVAYVLGSAHWGRGHASAAVMAMIDELVAAYRVHMLWAVLKRANTRSLRLLERLAFVPATDAQVAAHAIETDEVLMVLNR